MTDEDRVDFLLKKPFIKQKDLAEVLDASVSSVSREMKDRKVSLTRFGYPTKKVIEALDLDDYIETLIRLRAA